MKTNVLSVPLCFIVALAVSLSSTWLSAEAATNPDDVNVLNQLNRDWGGGQLSLWGSNTDPCVDGWVGVVCDATNSRVTQLFLSSKQLTGTIPAYIGNLSALTSLELSFNSGLHGSLPVELGSLTSLTSLSLQWCTFSGTIPSSLGQLTNLTFLALNNNNLTGSIPSSLGACSKLLWFDVAYNDLSGLLPVSTHSSDGLGLDTMTSIQHYHLSNNSFSGSIPPELGNAGQCVHILLDFNNLTGEIPKTLGNLSSLQILNLNYNQLSGTIPASLNNIVLVGSGSQYAGLHQLRLNHNLLTGMVPNLDSFNQLQYVDFSDNQFEPQLYPTWLNLSSSSLVTIKFDRCSLSGPLPPEILSYSSLQTLSLQGNALNGTLTIPADLASSLDAVYLQNNSITGINKLTNSAINFIQLQGNPICGTLEGLCNTTVTTSLWTSPLLNQNTCGGGCKDGLTSNPQNCTCSIPYIIVLQIRSPTFSNVDNTSLWDNFKSQTYSSLNGSNPALKLVPSQILVYNASVTPPQRVEVYMYFFPASGDSLSLAAQTYIQSSFLSANVTYTNLFAPVQLFNIVTPPGGVYIKHISGFSTAAIIGVAVGAAVAVIFVGLLVFLVCKHKRRADKAIQSRPFAAWGGDGADNGEAPKLKGARWFSFEEIKKMTNNFNEDNELGVGGYGRVYKGVVQSTGEVVAVKRAQEGSLQGAEEFKNEIELLSRVHHRNLVGLVGFCYEQGEQMLIYEYMPNGTLTEWLRGVKSNNPLDWERRLLIALGSARGLAYLHENANPPIIHRDVKSCNILLDEKLVAKVADFGLSQLVPESDDKAHTQIKGTMGYLDPEYYMTSMLSPKSDVYSFGVILLEILTGRPAILRTGHIVRDVKITLAKSGMEGIWEMLDPVLIDTPVQDLERFLKLALACVEETGAERPTMKEVEKQLESLVGPKSFELDGVEGSSSSKKFQPQLSGKQEKAAKQSHQLPASQNSSSTSHNSSSFKYSGFFAPSPVRPK